MAFAEVSGISFGIYRPNKENPLTNEQIESWSVSTRRGNLLTAKDILKKTGVEKRYVASSWESVADMAVRAADGLIQNRESADAVIVSTSYPTGENLGRTVKNRLGLKTRQYIEIGAACSGFSRGLNHIWQNREQYENRKVLFIATEKYSPTLASLRDGGINIDPSLAQTIFSDGAVAMLFEVGKDLEIIYADNFGIKAGYEGIIKMPINKRLIEPPYIEEEVAPSDSGYFEQNGSEVFKAVKRVVPGLVREAVVNAGFTAADISRVYPHQGSGHLVDVLQKDLQEFEIVKDIAEGNWSSASIPKALIRTLENGEVKKGDKVVFAGFGAGRGVFTSTVVARLA